MQLWPVGAANISHSGVQAAAPQVSARPGELSVIGYIKADFRGPH
jgi:hypothetical protein